MLVSVLFICTISVIGAMCTVRSVTGPYNGSDAIFGLSPERMDAAFEIAFLPGAIGIAVLLLSCLVCLLQKQRIADAIPISVKISFTVVIAITIMQWIHLEGLARIGVN